MHEDDDEHIHLGGEYDPTVYVGEHIHLLTVGIDIGSSTSHLLFSRLVLERQGRNLSSRYEVTHRNVVYRSPVWLTPYASPRQVDTAALSAFVDDAYRSAGFTPAQVDAGAVITTGEAALKENAAKIIQLVSTGAGKFVSATAGPNLEGLLAAHGSGAVGLSEPGRTVLNVDVGGGTTKFAVCRDGRVEETAAIHVGARLVVWDVVGRLVRCEDAGRRLAAELGNDIGLGVTVSKEELDRLAESMAGSILRVVRGEPLEGPAASLWITEPLRTPGPFHTVTFSGGVAEYIYGYERREFGDLGPRMSRAIVERSSGFEVLNPRERIHATCIGASQYAVQVSGSTIFISDPRTLPLLGLPVVTVEAAAPAAAQIADAVRAALGQMDIDEGRDRFALAVNWRCDTSYAALRALCDGLADALPKASAAHHPLVVVLDADVAGLVGRMLREDCGVAAPVVCVDQVALRRLDYVDIGQSLPDQTVVPISIKSLVFR